MKADTLRLSSTEMKVMIDFIHDKITAEEAANNYV